MWRLILRLLTAFPVGLLFGAALIAALGLEDSAARAATFSGVAFSYAVFLFTIWRAGIKRQAAFAAAGGDPQAAGVLLFGVMTPRRRFVGSDGSGSGGYYGDGDNSSDGGGSGGGGDGGGGGGGD
ncbi:hypothetical protein [Arthrobacter oryzae]|uniref:hypothetical protein n=1 Tax=Arthrobacter oryzae TaxID=409290 RepID=UPI002855C863|nr:hypothetical protein [Arthrobacter oryzae]MDR6507983.1 putative membrane protein YgcG [Arthrobacter oryzae]